MCAGSFISPELEEALQSIKGVVAAFERDVRTDVKWDWKRDHVPSALVRLTVDYCFTVAVVGTAVDSRE